jgi:hypothetical protein
MTSEIVQFLENEVRLEAADENPETPWAVARSWSSTVADLIAGALHDGIADIEDFGTYRLMEQRQQNAEEALFCLHRACAKAAYPQAQFGAEVILGGVDFWARKYQRVESIWGIDKSDCADAQRRFDCWATSTFYGSILAVGIFVS